MLVSSETGWVPLMLRLRFGIGARKGFDYSRVTLSCHIVWWRMVGRFWCISSLERSYTWIQVARTSTFILLCNMVFPKNAPPFLDVSGKLLLIKHFIRTSRSGSDDVACASVPRYPCSSWSNKLYMHIIPKSNHATIINVRALHAYNMQTWNAKWRDIQVLQDTHMCTQTPAHTHTLHVNLHRYDMHYCPSQTKLHTTMPPMPNKPSTRYSLVIPGITSAARPASWSSPAAARPLADPSPHSAGSVGHLGTRGELSAAVSHRFTAIYIGVGCIKGFMWRGCGSSGLQSAFVGSLA